MTQYQIVKKQLLETGSVSRNWALKNYISRLSAIILELKKDHTIHGEHVTVGNSKDYIYTLRTPKNTLKSNNKAITDDNIEQLRAILNNMSIRTPEDQIKAMEISKVLKSKNLFNIKMLLKTYE